MNICAVVICAHDCAEYIPDLIAGLKDQSQTPGWAYNIRIGVDACPKTSAALTRLGVQHYMAEKNVGHGVLRNALIYLAPADVYAYFDADDKMLPEYLLKNITALSDNKIVMAAKYNTDINLRIKNGPVIQNGGAMTIPVKIIKAVGGFAHYRCAIDTDLMDRAKMAGFGIEPIPQALYLRRVHPKALTRRADTGMGSDYRKKSWAEMTAARERGIIKIKPVTVKLSEVR